MKWLLSFALACVIAAGSVHPARAQTRFGVVLKDTSGADCLVLPGPPVAKGARIFVVFDESKAAVRATVGSPREVSCGEKALLSGTSYEISIDGPEDHDAGIAVLSPGATSGLRGGKVFIRTPDRTTPLHFATCASSEGLHFTAWRGPHRVWHEYYYLGFDVEPTCTEEEVGD